MNIRPANSHDVDAVRSLYHSAFPRGEGEIVSNVALKLLVEETVPQTLSLVAEDAGLLVGHVAFSPVVIDADRNIQGYILAPLAVDEDHQKQGIGSSLVRSGIRQLSAMSVSLVFVYGDPNYYARFGFVAEASKRFVPPYPLKYAVGWLGMTLGTWDLPRTPVNINCVNALCDPALW